MKAIDILLEHATSGMLTFDNYRKHLQAIAELEEIEEKVKVQDDLLKQYVKKRALWCCC